MCIPLREKRSLTIGLALSSAAEHRSFHIVRAGGEEFFLSFFLKERHPRSRRRKWRAASHQPLQTFKGFFLFPNLRKAFLENGEGIEKA